MDTLSAELARKLLSKDFANLVKRVQSGHKLTRAERTMLQNMAQAAGGDASGPTHAANFVELALILGVTRQALGGWRKRKDAPAPAANGLHEVAAWREFMKRNDLKGGSAAPDEETALKARKLLAEVEDRELRVAIRKGEHIALEEVRGEWTLRVARATNLLRNKFENELPPILSGLDATGIQAECRRAIDEVLAALHQGA